MRTEDGYIIQECLNGESEAFGVLVDKYREGIYAFVYAKLRDFHDAQDVTQEVFLHAYRNLRTLRRWESFASWLYRIASRRCKLWIRTASRRVDRDFIQDQDPEEMDAPSLASYRESQLDESVREALSALPEIHREVLVLRYFGGMTSVEIAKAIGVSPGAIRMRLTRAREQLKEEMVAMMDTAFEGQRLPMGFTLRVVQAIKHIKIQPMPRTAGLPWCLSLTAGIIIAVLSIGSRLNLPNLMDTSLDSALPSETQVTEVGEMPVDVLRIARIRVPFGKQGNTYGGGFQLPDQQNAVLMAPRGEGGQFPEEPSARLGKGTLGHIAYSPDGKLLAASEGMGILRLYDANNLNEIGLLQNPSIYYSVIAFSPDGKILASDDRDGTIYFWDVIERKQIGKLSGSSKYLTSIAFSPDGKILATASETDKNIRLWNVQEEKQSGVLRGHTDRVRVVAFSSDGKILASGSDDQTIRLWDVQEQKQIGILEGHTGIVSSITLSRDGKLLASSSGETAIRLWDVQEQKQIRLLQGNNILFPVAFNPDGKMLAYGDSGTICLWDVQEQKQIGSLQGHRSWIYSIIFNPDGKTLASKDGVEAIRLWNIQEQKQIGLLGGYTPPVRSLAFSPDGKTLASGSYEVLLWNVQEQKQIGLMEGHDAWVGSGIAFSPDGKIMASINKNEIYLFDVQEQKQIGTLTGHTDRVRSITFSPDGKILVSGSLDYTVRLWDVAGQKQIGILRNGSHAHGVAISPDGETIAAAIGGESLVRLWDAQTQKEIGTLRDLTAGWSVAFSPDGKTIASAGTSGLIRLWDFKEQTQIGALQGHAYRVESIVFSPDGKWLASTSQDGTARVWDVQEQKQIAILEGHGVRVDSVAFSPDGKWLASGGNEGTILLWEVNIPIQGKPVEPTGKLPGTWGDVKKTALLQNFPNPFNPETWIPFCLSETECVEINIHDSTGRLVRNLNLGQKPSGEYLDREKAVCWDGTNNMGESVSSGAYFYTIQAGDYTATKKMILAR